MGYGTDKFMIITKIKAGLGNQMFQYATAKQLAIELKTDMYLDLTYYYNSAERQFGLGNYNIDYKIAEEKDIINLKNSSNPNLIFWLLKKMKISNKYYKKTHWNDKRFDLYFNQEKKPNNSIYLDGWFGNPRYFQKIRDILIFDFIPKAISITSLNLAENIRNSNSVAVHIRRGDYLGNSYFFNLPTIYYSNAISYMANNESHPFFYFFSDDIDFVKKEFKELRNAFFINLRNEIKLNYGIFQDVEELYLISLCKHQIIANSTYSWWGAWLNTNPDKKVIAPKKWYNNMNAQKQYERGHLIPNNWIKL